MGWMKANFDGSNKGNLRKARCDEVLRDHYSRVVDAIAIPIGQSTGHKAKATKFLFMIRMDVEYEFPNLWLEGDSLNIVNMLNSKSMISWSIEGSIMEIKDLIKNFGNVIITHIFLEGNVFTNWIANKAAYREAKMSW